jgi:hypothetical protein
MTAFRTYSRQYASQRRHKLSTQRCLTDKTRSQLGWEQARTQILTDFGSILCT